MQFDLEGSSPLTRGKLPAHHRPWCVHGLIPAHAGKTQAVLGLSLRGRAHPRSRGENAARPRRWHGRRGSSPLTRGKRKTDASAFLAHGLIPAHAGKRDEASESLPCGGLIPAHAGKTMKPKKQVIHHQAHPRSRGENGWKSCPTCPRRWLIPAHAGKTLSDWDEDSGHGAHPRSRGENESKQNCIAFLKGSSPLTRGKLAGVGLDSLGERLIPAHAGKTPDRGGARRPSGAHPRSRGENTSPTAPSSICRGSSPLTRGKPAGPAAGLAVLGLIPAHAGKTSGVVAARGRVTAHPRSRGENYPISPAAQARTGSSPLTRGKRDRPPRPPTAPRLIPAHAGKTVSCGKNRRAAVAHPRSRGENLPWEALADKPTGSSPLTRGKHCAGDRFIGALRLIPAHAGKTFHALGQARPGAAHPRSRGENARADAMGPDSRGSSPLTRGKPTLARDANNVEGLIPAHAGKTAMVLEAVGSGLIPAHAGKTF